MSERVAAVWGSLYEEASQVYDFGPQHPLRPGRVILAAELAQMSGLFDLPHVDVLAPRMGSRSEIELVHGAAYIDAITRIGAGGWDPDDASRWGVGPGDNPPFTGMHDAGALVAGSAIVAADALWSGGFEHVWYPAGGLHHAMPNRASGFCIYDDPAISIKQLLASGAERVAYLDVDVHHGDGVQQIFYDDPRVLTISIHESGRFLFPGTGSVDELGTGDAVGTSVNVPLPPYTGDDAYLAVFERVVPPIVEAFKPTVLFTQLGCDTHASDPLAHLQLTTHGWRRLATLIHQLAHTAAAGRWIATGGGGYSVEVVPRGWANYFAEMCGGINLAPELPEEWRIRARSFGVDDPPTMLHDEINAPDRYIEEAAIEANASAERTVERVFGYFSL